MACSDRQRALVLAATLVLAMASAACGDDFTPIRVPEEADLLRTLETDAATYRLLRAGDCVYLETAVDELGTRVDTNGCFPLATAPRASEPCYYRTDRAVDRSAAAAADGLLAESRDADPCDAELGEHVVWGVLDADVAHVCAVFEHGDDGSSTPARIITVDGSHAVLERVFAVDVAHPGDVSLSTYVRDGRPLPAPDGADELSDRHRTACLAAAPWPAPPPPTSYWLDLEVAPGTALPEQRTVQVASAEGLRIGFDLAVADGGGSLPIALYADTRALRFALHGPDGDRDVLLDTVTLTLPDPVQDHLGRGSGPPPRLVLTIGPGVAEGRADFALTSPA